MFLKIVSEKIDYLDYSLSKEGFSRFQVLELNDD